MYLIHIYIYIYPPVGIQPRSLHAFRTTSAIVVLDYYAQAEVSSFIKWINVKSVIVVNLNYKSFSGYKK
jgi:hypothetical protein